jgi:hypothetical protein
MICGGQYDWLNIARNLEGLSSGLQGFDEKRSRSRPRRLKYKIFKVAT